MYSLVYCVWCVHCGFSLYSLYFNPGGSVHVLATPEHEEGPGASFSCSVRHITGMSPDVRQGRNNLWNNNMAKTSENLLRTGISGEHHVIVTDGASDHAP